MRGSGLSLQGAGRYRVQVEHFLDGSRNGFRIRQLGFGDPRIFSSDSDCDENLVFNDVICNLLSPRAITMSAEDQPQEIAVGGSAQAYEPAAQETVVAVDTRGGDDIVTCRGTLRLVDNRRLKRTLTRARYRVPRRHSATVRLRLTRAQARRARARHSITAITRERGVSRKGPRSTFATLVVR